MDANRWKNSFIHASLRINTWQRQVIQVYLLQLHSQARWEPDRASEQKCSPSVPWKKNRMKVDFSKATTKFCPAKNFYDSFFWTCPGTFVSSGGQCVPTPLPSRRACKQWGLKASPPRSMTFSVLDILKINLCMSFFPSVLGLEFQP